MKKPHNPGCRGRFDDGAPNPIDVHVGRRVKQRRVLLGLSQEDLAAKLGLTFQQVQKYERAANRMSGSRLYDMARALAVPIQYFYDEMDKQTERSSPAAMARGTVITKLLPQEMEHDRRLTLELVRAYWRIERYEVRQHIANLFKAIAGERTTSLAIDAEL